MLVIVVGGIPIAMPTVLSVTLALGAARLAKEGAIVARMSAVEEMAGMSILCSDKTGALLQLKALLPSPRCTWFVDVDGNGHSHWPTATGHMQACTAVLHELGPA